MPMPSAPPMAIRAIDALGHVVCACGCGRPTRPATRTDRCRGQIKGQPNRFCRGHNARVLYRTVKPPPPPPETPPPPPLNQPEPDEPPTPEVPARPAAPRANPAVWEACLAGREPAEILDRQDRQNLVVLLFDAGWTLAEIAHHTRETQSVICRIARETLGYVPGGC